MGRLVISYAFLMALGFAGAHRFYLGRTYTAILYLCTGGFLGIGVVIDFFMLPFMVAEDINDEGGSVMDFILKLFIAFMALFIFSLMVTAMLGVFITIF